MTPGLGGNFWHESDEESSDFGLPSESLAVLASLFETTEYSSWTCVSSVLRLRYPVPGVEKALV
jgi:hypothetical protein